MRVDNTACLPIKPLQENAPKKPDETDWNAKLQSWGLFYLQRYACSKARLTQYLTRKIRDNAQGDTDLMASLVETAIPPLVARWEELGYLNDQAYAVALAKGLLRSGRSQSFIAGKLKEKGVSPALTQDVLADLQNRHGADMKLGAAVRLMQKKRYGCYALKDVAPEKAMGAFARAGFDYPTARAVLQLERDEAEDILSRLQAI